MKTPTAFSSVFAILLCVILLGAPCCVANSVASSSDLAADSQRQDSFAEDGLEISNMTTTPTPNSGQSKSSSNQTSFGNETCAHQAPAPAPAHRSPINKNSNSNSNSLNHTASANRKSQYNDKIPQPDPSIVGYPVSRYSPDRRTLDRPSSDTVRPEHQHDDHQNPLGVPAPEWKARTELAAAYRFLYLAGLGSDQAAQCLMLRTDTRSSSSDTTTNDPNNDPPITTFLMADWGVWFEEVTASNLLHFTVHGERVEYTCSSTSSSSSSTKNASHSYHYQYVPTNPLQANTGCIPVAKAIFESRPDVSMIVHIHPPAVMAVGGTAWGLLPLSQAAFFLWGQVSRDDYDFTYQSSFEEGLVHGFANGQRAMLLNHHGMYAVGRDVAEAIFVATHLTQACDVQVRTLSMAGGDLDQVRFVGV